MVVRVLMLANNEDFSLNFNYYTDTSNRFRSEWGTYNFRCSVLLSVVKLTGDSISQTIRWIQASTLHFNDH